VIACRQEYQAALENFKQRLIYQIQKETGL
jgi:hypothetical protein